MLVVEDQAAVRDLMVVSLSQDGVTVTAVADGAEALETLKRQEFDVVFTDLRMPRVSGLELMRAIRSEGYDAEVIVVTGHAEVSTAIEALQLHAFDYLTKPFSLAELQAVMVGALRHRRLRHENRLLRRAVLEQAPEPVLLGKSPPMERARSILDRAGRSLSHVLVLGESGSGKELAARAIHRASARRDLPFLAINCAALPNELLESELFGHEKGAFTGATARRHGLLELADGGTLFLDELAEMSLAMQAKLLRAIDQGEIRRLGADRTQHVDVRVIAATNKDLRREVALSQFREDLYYRLSVVVVELPPLRERAADIPLLVQHFARVLAGAGHRPISLTPEAMDAFKSYAWPGNVRELRNVVERLTVLAGSEEITATEAARHLPVPLAGHEDTDMSSLEEVERRHILKVLERTGGSRTRAAKILQVDPKTLYNKLRAWGRSPAPWSVVAPSHAGGLPNRPGRAAVTG